MICPSKMIDKASLSDRFEMACRTHTIRRRLYDFIDRSGEVLRDQYELPEQKEQIKRLMVTANHFIGVVAEISLQASQTGAQDGLLDVHGKNEVSGLLDRVELFCNITDELNSTYKAPEKSIC